MTSIQTIHRLRRSPTVWVLVGTLVPALICTLLARVWFSEEWQLVGFFWYSIPANSFVYLPHEPAVVYAGALYDPWIVTVAGSIATVVAGIVDYYVVKKVFEFRRVALIKETSLYQKAVRYFYWRPWLTIAVFAISPLPYYPIRLLAPSSGYPLWRYVSAYVVGRIPRYYLLALGGAWVPVPTKYIVVMVISIILSSILWVLWARRRAWDRQKGEESPVQGSAAKT